MGDIITDIEKLGDRSDEISSFKKEVTIPSIDAFIEEEKKPKKAKKIETEEIKPEIKVSEKQKDEVKITEVEKTEESEKVQDLDDFEKVLSLIEIKTDIVGDKEIKTASFCTMTNDVIDLLLHPEIVDQVSNYSPSSAILPLEIYEKNNKKILKKFKEIEVIKKAV